MNVHIRIIRKVCLNAEIFDQIRIFWNIW